MNSRLTLILFFIATAVRAEQSVRTKYNFNSELKPAQGKTVVRIELVGRVDEKDEFGIVEVTGKKLPDTTGKNSSGRLEIIEAEIYEPLDGANAK